jgi:NAD(P)-dependent dehydrogenase (short-subunit alcohol dehydrogenase family)
MNVDLSGKTALVTGASSGFGRHFAMTLGNRGARVIAAARRTNLLETLAADASAAGLDIRPLELDVADERQVEKAFDALGPIDIVINNAGMAGRDDALACSPEEWRQTYDVNVHGAWFVAQAAARKLKEAGRGGSIINIASITGIRTGASTAAYASSKAALIHMTHALAMEWARYRIRVNALAPGYFETDLNRDFLASDYGQAMLKRIPQRRFGEMKDLDGPLLLLASDASAYMTGSVITVDGGHLVAPL